MHYQFDFCTKILHLFVKLNTKLHTIESKAKLSVGKGMHLHENSLAWLHYFSQNSMGYNSHKTVHKQKWVMLWSIDLFQNYVIAMTTAFYHFHWGHINNFHCATLKFSEVLSSSRTYKSSRLQVNKRQVVIGVEKSQNINRADCSTDCLVCPHKKHLVEDWQCFKHSILW